MKLKSARFKGLIGVYRASGLKDITIDFTKCKNKIVLITGPNGSGKSTINDALNPLPDSQSNYIKGEPGFKELEYIKDGVLYQIHIDYPVNNRGERTTTKAFISKWVDGVRVDLNVNGNVGSYKCVIENEFKLDPNFIALTRLSVEDRGIVDKTPAERKKYVGAVIEQTEVYNNIYKVLNKRSSVFKSMENSIVAKIDSIGNADVLNGELSNIDAKIKILEDNKTTLTKSLADAEAIIKISDPNGTLRAEYIQLQSQIASIDSELGTLKIFLEKFKDKPYYSYVDSLDKCSESQSILNTKIAEINNTIHFKKESIQTTLATREEESKALQIKQARLASLTSDQDYETLKTQTNNTRANIESYKAILKSAGLSENSLITKEEFIAGVDVIRTIREQISVIRSSAYESHIELAVKYKLNGYDIVGEINRNNELIVEKNAELNKINEEIVKYDNLRSISDVLSKRPSTCKDDTCSFIKNAIEAVAQEPDKNLDRLGTQKYAIEDEIKVLQDRQDDLQAISNIMHNIDIIVRSANSSKGILDKLPNGNTFTDIESLLNMIQTGRTFEEFDSLYTFLDYVNVLEEIRASKELLTKLEANMKVYESKVTMIDELQSDIDSLVEKLSNATNTILSVNDEIKELEKSVMNLEDTKTAIVSAKEKYEQVRDLENNKQVIVDRLAVIDTNIANIETAVQNANSINTELKRVTDELNPLLKQRDEINYSLNKLSEYIAESELYHHKYEVVELIKKYSSPTKEGIQDLFIQVYLGQTIGLANSLLKMLFNGELELMKPIINSEFRIPCKSRDTVIVNDDISSCSSAQKCMISTLLSAALMQQASPVYNILQLDEMDGALDQDNRARFPMVLESVIDLLKIESCIMISHASESVLNNTDIICLGRVNNELPSGNIIFNYEDYTV